MAIRLSTGFRQALLGTQGLKEILDGGVIDIYSGSQPSSADYTETGTKLLRISSTCGTGISDGLRFGTSAAGVLPLTTPAWEGTVIADGVAGWFRFYGTGGTSGSSSSQIRLDGAVGISGSDMDISHTNLVTATKLSILTFNITEPAS